MIIGIAKTKWREEQRIGGTKSDAPWTVCCTANIYRSTRYSEHACIWIWISCIHQINYICTYTEYIIRSLHILMMYICQSELQTITEHLKEEKQSTSDQKEPDHAKLNKGVSHLHQFRYYYNGFCHYSVLVFECLHIQSYCSAWSANCGQIV